MSLFNRITLALACLSLSSSVIGDPTKEDSASCGIVHKHLITQENLDKELDILSKFTGGAFAALLSVELQKHVGTEFSGREWIRAVHIAFSETFDKIKDEKKLDYYHSRYPKVTITNVALSVLPDEDPELYDFYTYGPGYEID